jgi:hypothetical protein
MAEVMHRTGLSRRGLEYVGVRWVAVRHADDHVHLVATLARQDGGRARLSYERRRVREAMHWAERKYGLQVTGHADRTAPSRPSRAEWEKSRRAGRTIPPRVALRRKVEAAAVAAASEAEFFAGLEARRVQVRLRYSTIDPAAVTGYAVGLPGDLSKAGTQVWFSGGKLAPDLTLPKLRHRWDPAMPIMPGRLDVREVYAQATAAAQLAAQEIKAGKRGANHTIWAAADLLTAAADATGNHELQVSADFFRRAALEPWGRIPRPSPTGQMVRASARFLAATRRGCPVASVLLVALVLALAILAQAVAERRAAQQRGLQAQAARAAAARLNALADSTKPSVSEGLLKVAPVQPRRHRGQSRVALPVRETFSGSRAGRPSVR